VRTLDELCDEYKRVHADASGVGVIDPFPCAVAAVADMVRAEATPPAAAALVARLRRLSQDATPAPWAHNGRGDVWEDTGHAVGDPDAPDTRLASANEWDAALIAEMRNALPALLDALTPPAAAEVGAIRERHEREDANYRGLDWQHAYDNAHEDRATLLTEVDRLTAALAASEEQRKADVIETARLVSKGNGLTREYVEQRNAERLLLARYIAHQSDVTGPLFLDAISVARRIVAEAESAPSGEVGS
jgi:hypothetical protein